MGRDPVAGAPLAREPDDIEGIFARCGDRMACRIEEIIAESQAQIVRWMVAIFFASAALVGAAVSALVLFLTGRL